MNKALGVLLAVILAASACGYKAPPQPPEEPAVEQGAGEEATTP